MWLLCDCDNFYASCERVFSPDLNGKPVVILSNNDGCIVARSKEAKELGIKMGTPFYQVKDLLERNGVAVFSSNYTLYGDLSRRVMSLLSKYSDRFYQYSIDEGFLDMSGFSSNEYIMQLARQCRAEITRGVGIPVTLGIAPTKTLAKMASKFGKKYKGYKGVCMIDTEEKRLKALELFPVEDVWGIGRRTLEKLEYYGIRTAKDYAEKNPEWIRRMFKITGYRTWLELNGTNAISIEELPEKQSICTSRSFADQGISKLEDLETAVANFASSCAEKLRRQHTVCRLITVFAYTSRFRTDLPSNVINATIPLSVATNDTREIIREALGVIRRHWNPNIIYYYKKAGVILSEISSDKIVEQNLFDTVDRKKQHRLNKVVDKINSRHSANSVKVATQFMSKRFQLKREHLSKCYTTNLAELMKVK